MRKEGLEGAGAWPVDGRRVVKFCFPGGKEGIKEQGRRGLSSPKRGKGVGA